MKTDDLADEELLRCIVNGDKEALEVLYNRYASKVFSLAKHMLRQDGVAEEVTQEIFLTLWQKASTYRENRGRPSTWLMTIAHHRIDDYLRQQRRNQNSLNQAGQEFVRETLLSQVSTEETAHRNLAYQQIQEALKTLPKEQQEVVFMAYYEGYTHSEIARKLNQPLGTVKTRLRLAMQKLKAALNPEEAV